MDLDSFNQLIVICVTLMQIQLYSLMARRLLVRPLLMVRHWTQTRAPVREASLVYANSARISPTCSVLIAMRRDRVQTSLLLRQAWILPIKEQERKDLAFPVLSSQPQRYPSLPEVHYPNLLAIVSNRLRSLLTTWLPLSLRTRTKSH